jgi:hypothetical protein
VELDGVAQPAPVDIEQLHGADVVVGVLAAHQNGEATATADLLRGAETLTQRRTVLVVNNGTTGTRLEQEESSLPILYCNLGQPESGQAWLRTTFESYQTLFDVSSRIGARVCGVIASDLHGVTPQWFDSLLGPPLELGFDLVAPQYARHKWEGLLNRSILSPLNRALYGKRIQNPMGPDFGLSGKLLHWVLDDRARLRNANPTQNFVPIVSAAVRGNFQVCQSNLAARPQLPADWMNLSSLLAQILDPLFFDMDRNAAIWQRVRGSQPVPLFGDPAPAPEPSTPVDVNRLLDSFQLGVNSLQDIWGLVLPPTSLFEIRKMTRLLPGKFRMPDELWVGIVYDFALAHRMRTISRDHLLRSFTPLYLGWIASYATEMEAADPAMVEERFERLAKAYEAGKPYLVSRWRWPDRFNP